MNIVIDFETRSPVDIKQCGAYVYAAHPNTEVVMLSVMTDNLGDKGRVWVAEPFRNLTPTEISNSELTELICSAERIAAHNAQFERAIWKHKMEPIGFSPLDIEKVHCTAAQSRMCGLPGDVEGATKAWNPQAPQKDSVGHKLMLKLSKPRKFLKAECASFRGGNTDPNKVKSMQEYIYSILSQGRVPDIVGYNDYIAYHEKKAEYERFLEYCRNDVIAELTLFLQLPQLSPDERETWLLDQRINDRGVFIDRESCIGIREMVKNLDEDLAREAYDLSDNMVTSMKSPSSIVAWLRFRGVDMPSVNKEFVSEALEHWDLPPDVRRFLEIRQTLGKSATAKFQAMLNCSSIDSRARGCFVYHGASTGRFSGSLFQPQNLPRPSEKNKVDGEEYTITEEDILLAKNGDVAQLNDIWSDAKVLASDCIRGMMHSAPGKRFICADYSAVEGRGLAWLSGEEHILQSYRDKKDIYKVAAAGIYKIPYEQVDGGGKGPQRQVGKTAELALSYGGGWGAMLRFGADKKGLTEEEGKEIIKGWRGSRPATTEFWRKMVECSVEAMQSPTCAVVRYRDVCFKRSDRFLLMRLPSGRKLYYPDARVEEVEMAWSTEEKPAFKKLVTAMTQTATKQFVRRPLNHLILTENCFSGETRVLTNSGWKRIKNITSLDKVFDGEKFVRHGGLICKGMQPVQKRLRVRATKSHLIRVGSVWKEFSKMDVHDWCIALEVGRNSVGSLLLRQSGGSLKNTPKLNVNVVNDLECKQVLSESGSICHAESARQEREAVREGLPLNVPYFLMQSYVAHGRIDTQEFFQDATIQIIKRILIMGEGGYRFSGNGRKIDLNFLNMLKHFQDGTRMDLTSTESITKETMNRVICGLCQGSKTQTTEEFPLELCILGKNIQYESLEMYLLQHGEKQQYYITRNKDTMQSTWSEDMSEQESNTLVYDIKDCGDLHQYCVLTSEGPIIVHNCTQGMCRDLLVHAMKNLEKAGYPVVMHIHDEIVSEVPECFGSVEEFERIMCELPDWADGFPLVAEGWEGKIYQK